MTEHPEHVASLRRQLKALGRENVELIEQLDDAISKRDDFEGELVELQSQNECLEHELARVRTDLRNLSNWRLAFIAAVPMAIASGAPPFPTNATPWSKTA